MSYGGYVVPAFYSSTCGGTSQAAGVAFPKLGGAIDLAPLRSERRGDWCRSSKYYRWGPITRSASQLAQRLAQWGRANDHAIAELRGLGRIDITERTGAGRPSQFTITDTAGHRYTLAPEAFRFACNETVRGLPALTSKQQLRSSHVQVRVKGSAVQFWDGRGWGHGVGMCQWGAQGMAEQGYNAKAILQHFYPGAHVQRLY